MIRHREVFGDFVDFTLIHGCRAGRLAVDVAALHGHVDLARAHRDRRSAEGLDGLGRNLAVAAQLQAFEIFRFF